jgi:hypothetical protein
MPRYTYIRHMHLYYGYCIYLYHWEGKDSNLRQHIATEFTAQPAIPTNGTFLYTYKYIRIIYVLLTLINPVQLPLHEPYFDLTPIKVTHTKICHKRD